MSIISKLDEIISSGTEVYFDSLIELYNDQMEDIFGENYRSDLLPIVKDVDNNYDNVDHFTEILYFEDKGKLYFTRLSSGNFHLINMEAYETPNGFVLYQPVRDEDLKTLKNRYEEMILQAKALEKVLNHPAARIKKIFL